MTTAKLGLALGSLSGLVMAAPSGRLPLLAVLTIIGIVALSRVAGRNARS